MSTTSIKLYADMEDAEILLVPDRSKLIDASIGKILDYTAVINSFVLINCHAIKEKMYPLAGPFNFLKYTPPNGVKCIVIGGVPPNKDKALLAKWTGSSYSFDDTIGRSDLHYAICHNQYSSSYRVNDLDSKLVGLQKSGVWLIPEALSTYTGGTEVMLKLWEPFIWNLLHEMSILREDVPILFTTEAALEKFNTAVMSSKYKFISILSEKTEREDGKMLDAVEKIIKVNGEKWFNFFTKATK